MAKEIHFEVFSRRGSKGGWTLTDVKTDRDEAMEFAQEMMRDGSATGVKVVKETYDDETGDFLSLKIFENGHNKLKSTPTQENAPRALAAGELMIAFASARWPLPMVAPL